MEIAVIDGDFISNKRQRFPNLCCMKISAYRKSLGDTVTLKTDFTGLEQFDKVFISKVFTDTHVPEDVMSLSHVSYGGTGFFYDKANFLPDCVEHMKPDYSLYDAYLQGAEYSKTAYKYFTGYSIGYTTRFCFRKCGFCVNKNYNGVQIWSPIDEFLAPNRKKICLLDDNLLGYPDHCTILAQLQEIGKPFQYKQGLDIKLLNDRNIKLLAASNYDGEYIFSFDDVTDKDIIRHKLELWRKHTAKGTKVYVLCAYDKHGSYDGEFWAQDVKATFERIKILFDYQCLPYIMRYKEYKKSPEYGTYVNIASWCNQPRFAKILSYEDYCYTRDGYHGGNTAVLRYLEAFRHDYPRIAQDFYGLKYCS